MIFHLPLFVLLFFMKLCFDLVAAGAIAAWVAGLGVAPQVIMQNHATGKIFYSLCNSNGSIPIFPANEPASFNFEENLTPKKGTSLAGTGYIDGDSIFAAIWFQREDDQIVWSLWKCDDTGHFTGTGNERTIGVDQPVHPNTGLMGLNLGETAGFRVYFQDKSKALSIMSYNEAERAWNVKGNVSRDMVRGFPIAAGFLDVNRITVVTPRDESNIEVSMVQPNGTWIISTFPTPLGDVFRGVHRIDDKPKPLLPPTNSTDPEDFVLDVDKGTPWSLEAWDGAVGGIGLAVNDDSSHNIFYIGNDFFLHSILGSNDVWNICPRQNERAWPRADAPNAKFATAYGQNGNEVFIYYMSGGNLTQIHRSGPGIWERAIPLLKYNSTLIKEPARRTGLSTGSKAGIGVSVSAVGIGLLLFATYIIIRRKKRGRGKGDDETKPVTVGTSRPPSQQLIYYEMPDHQYIPEMPSHEYIHEVPTENNH